MVSFDGDNNDFRRIMLPIFFLSLFTDKPLLIDANVSLNPVFDKQMIIDAIMLHLPGICLILLMDKPMFFYADLSSTP